MIRDAVGVTEAAWEERLGASRFADLRSLLLEFNRPSGPSDASDGTSASRNG